MIGLAQIVIIFSMLGLFLFFVGRVVLTMAGHHPISRRVRQALDDQKIADAQLATTKQRTATELVELKHQATLELAKDQGHRAQLLGLPSPSDKVEDAEVIEAKPNSNNRYVTDYVPDWRE